MSISGRSVILTLDEPPKRAIRASDKVEFRYVTPPSGTPAIQDIAGNYASSCEFGEPPSEARNETDPGLLEPVSAEFTMVPASHDGPGTEIVFQIEFNEPVRVDMGPNSTYLLDVEGGIVTSAWWLDGDTTIWEIVLEPTSNDDVTITLLAGRACDSRGAPCGSGERRLSNQPEHTVTGSDSDLAKSNSPASGGPRIEGVPQTGQTLVATTSGIQDQDGLSGVVFAYQWIRHDLEATIDTEIDGATGKTYIVTAQDEGKALKVSVTFTDDGGNDESMMSFAVIVPPSQTRNAQPVNTPATGAPAIEGSPVVGQTLTATTKGIADDEGIANAVFTYQWLADDAEINGATASTYAVGTGDESKALRVRVQFTDDAGNPESLTSEATDEVQARPNSPATGLPTISGTAQMGQTLTAGTSGIADSDGLSNAVLAYLWLADDVAIGGATSSAYTLIAADEGKTIKVRVTFTDDAGNNESLTSDATSPVTATLDSLTVTLENHPASHNGTDVFTFDMRFSEHFRLSYKTLRDHAFTIDGGTVKKAQRQEEGSNIGWTITIEPDSSASVSVVLPATTDCEHQGAICTDDGRMLSEELEFTVAGPSQ